MQLPLYQVPITLTLELRSWFNKSNDLYCVIKGNWKSRLLGRLFVSVLGAIAATELEFTDDGGDTLIAETELLIISENRRRITY